VRGRGLRGAALAAAVAALAVLGTAPSAPAKPGQPGQPGSVKFSPDEAQALASAPGGSDGVVVQHVPASAAVAASQEPGARVEVAPGFSSAATAAAAANACFSWHSGWHWGTWPYNQSIDEYTYYCAVYGQYITMRSTNVTAGGALCGVESRDNWITSGGIGYFWMVVHAQARFSCPTVVPWIHVHPTDWLETSYNAWGNASQVAAS
jgi:hypothetical protein